MHRNTEKKVMLKERTKNLNVLNDIAINRYVVFIKLTHDTYMLCLCNITCF